MPTVVNLPLGLLLVLEHTRVLGLMYRTAGYLMLMKWYVLWSLSKYSFVVIHFSLGFGALGLLTDGFLPFGLKPVRPYAFILRVMALS